MFRKTLTTALAATLMLGLAAPAAIARGDDAPRKPQQQMHRPEARHDSRDDHRQHVPPAPQGQHYARHGDQLVRVDDQTGAIVAALGLITAFAVATSQ
ncbi:RcnB family protein [Pseudooceanicola sp. C21-150M6]|uniref:RcnB family protein n=1 Tax=Pseudooceanicola sp. C21-150M6 TaxID=3434355 RepID=UPI003D7FF8B9